MAVMIIDSAVVAAHKTGNRLPGSRPTVPSMELSGNCCLGDPLYAALRRPLRRSNGTSPFGKPSPARDFRRGSAADALRQASPRLWAIFSVSTQ